MKTKINFNFSLEDLSSDEMLMLINGLDAITHHSSENSPSKELLAKLKEICIEVGLICEGCEVQTKTPLARIKCPISNQESSLCSSCYQKRREYLERL